MALFAARGGADAAVLLCGDAGRGVVFQTAELALAPADRGLVVYDLPVPLRRDFGAGGALAGDGVGFDGFGGGRDFDGFCGCGAWAGGAASDAVEEGLGAVRRIWPPPAIQQSLH